MDKSIEQFFHDYSAAFEAAEGLRIAEFYHVPCMTIRVDGSFHEFRTADDIAEFFGQFARAYIGEGMRSGRPQSLETNVLGSGSAMATIEWALKRENGSTIRTWWQTYNLKKTDTGWKILLATMHQS